MKRIALFGSTLFATFLVISMADAEERKLKVATFAGGCFWCTEADFDKVEGVLKTTSGYIGGKEVDPKYEDVARGLTGHAEAVQVEYDPTVVSYEKLLDIYWKSVDPLTKNAQFCDVGTQYRTAIFYHGEEQQTLALNSKEKIEKSGRFSSPLVTEIVEAGTFYPAEDYHQDYYKKNPMRYQLYRTGCGRDSKLKKLWG